MSIPLRQNLMSGPGRQNLLSGDIQPAVRAHRQAEACPTRENVEGNGVQVLSGCLGPLRLRRRDRPVVQAIVLIHRSRCGECVADIGRARSLRWSSIPYVQSEGNQTHDWVASRWAARRRKFQQREMQFLKVLNKIWTVDEWGP
jgi:hypothetical protein